MNYTDRNRLRSKRVEIVKNLEPGDILDLLQDDEVLTATDCEFILNGKTRKERTRCLLDILPRRGPKAYNSFAHALRVTRYEYLNINSDCDEKQPSLLSNPDCKVPECQKVFTSTDFSENKLQMYIQFIYENVDPIDILDYLYQEYILSENECEIIKAGKTRKTRCLRLIDKVSCLPPSDVVTILQDACKSKYPFVSQIGNDSIDKSTSPYVRILRIKKCRKRQSENSYTQGCTRDSLDGEGFFLHGHSLNRRTKQKNMRLPITQLKHKTKGIWAGTSKGGALLDVLRMGRTVDSVLYDFSDLSLSPSTIEFEQSCWPITPENITWKQPQTISPLVKTHLLVAFNYLSTLINQGKFDLFEVYIRTLKRQHKMDSDLLCLFCYLQASRELFRTNSDTAKELIRQGLQQTTKTSNPQYFIVQLLSAKTRMYLSRRHFEKFQKTLDEAKMLIETDPVGCTGHAAGWLYLNEARNVMNQMGFINFQSPSALSAFSKLNTIAKNSLKRSIYHFQRDLGKDKSFGFGYAISRLTILLLQCGDNGRFMNILYPKEEDISRAGKNLELLYKSHRDMPNILKMHFYLAKCDFHYRRNDLQSAKQYAEIAHQLSIELEMLEYSNHAYNRLAQLRKHLSLCHPSLNDSSEVDFSSVIES